MPRKATLSVKQAADTVGMSTQWIYNLIRNKRIRASKVDGRYTVQRADVVAYHREWLAEIEQLERVRRGDLTDDEWWHIYDPP